MDEGGYAALEGGGGSFRDILKDKKEAASARTGKARPEIRGRRRAPHRRIRGAPPNGTEQLQARPLPGRTLHPEKAVRPRPRTLRAGQKIRHGQRPVARSIHRRHPRQDGSTTNWSSSIPSTRTTPRRWRKSRPTSSPSRSPNARSAWKNIPTDLAIRYEMGVLYFQTGKSARPSRNSRRRRATHTNASPR